jgi:hypothetical protein
MCKSAYGLCKGAKVKGRAQRETGNRMIGLGISFQVAGGSHGWQVVESVFPTANR